MRRVYFVLGAILWPLLLMNVLSSLTLYAMLSSDRFFGHVSAGIIYDQKVVDVDRFIAMRGSDRDLSTLKEELYQEHGKSEQAIFREEFRRFMQPNHDRIIMTSFANLLVGGLMILTIAFRTIHTTRSPPESGTKV